MNAVQMRDIDVGCQSRGNSVRPYQDFHLRPTCRKMSRSSILGSLLLVLAFTFIIAEYVEAQFLRRILGESSFCEQKYEKCMHERSRMTKKGCEKRMDVKYGCHFHNGVHHPHPHPDKHHKPQPHNDSHHPHTEKPKEHPKSQHHPHNDSHHPHTEKPKEHPKSPHH